MDEPGAIESSIRSAREASTPYYSILASSGRRGLDVLSTAYSHSASLYGSLREQGNDFPKAAVITFSGLSGLLLASRKGFIRKILYTTLGLSAAAVVCYPEKSRELLDISAYIARRRAPDLIKELTGVDVSPYLDPKKFDRVKSEESSPSESSSSGSSPSSSRESSTSGRQ